MQCKIYLLALLATLLLTTQSRADITVTAETAESSFKFATVPAPSLNDAATTATFKLIDGRADANSPKLDVLHNSQLPTSEDQPQENFFFAAGSGGGLIEIAFGSAKSIKQVSTYSWHSSLRAPQVYRLYAAAGDAAELSHTLTKGSDPAQSGWELIASVDSRATKSPGNQQGVLIADNQGPLGKYRYLLLDISPTEKQDGFGNTFFSEIDVVDADGPALQPIPQSVPKSIEFATDDGKYHFTIDVTNADDLTEWTERELKPVVTKWYPQIVDMFPSEGYVAPARVTLRYLPGARMQGIPAYAAGSTVSLNADWFRKELKREARGAVVHELVHVVQAYSGGRRNGRTPTPGWIVEGIPDYVRWFLYEPETKGAEITARSLANARYDASYRVSGNFLDWVAREYDKDLVMKLNQVARQGKYTAEFWKTTTGKTEQELDSQWKEYHRQRLKL